MCSSNDDDGSPTMRDHSWKGDRRSKREKPEDFYGRQVKKGQRGKDIWGF